MQKDLFNLSNNQLSKTNNLKQEKTNKSIIEKFIHELQDYLTKLQSESIVKNLHSNTILAFAKYDGNFAECFDYENKKIYYISKDNIIGPKPEIGETLKWYSQGKFYVDYTGIPVEESKIEDYLKECSIAT